MDDVACIRPLFDDAYRQLEATPADATPGQARWLPPGKALPLGAQHVHVVTGEDGMLTGTRCGEISRLKRLQWARGNPD